MTHPRPARFRSSYVGAGNEIARAVLPVLARRCLLPGADNPVKRRKFSAVTIINVGSVDFAPQVRRFPRG